MQRPWRLKKERRHRGEVHARRRSRRRTTRISAPHHDAVTNYACQPLSHFIADRHLISKPRPDLTQLAFADDPVPSGHEMHLRRVLLDIWHCGPTVTKQVQIVIVIGHRMTVISDPTQSDSPPDGHPFTTGTRNVTIGFGLRVWL